MQICRCPHCQKTFQLSIPPDSVVWEQTPTDEDGLLLWVCLDCHREGLAPVSIDAARAVGHDTSYRHGPTTS